MKKLILAYFLTFPFLLTAQDIFIPDANFLSRLIQLGIDTNGDDKIQLAEAEVVNTLGLSNGNISDLTGIEAFTNLLALECYNNQLENLNLSYNYQLEDLNCSYNNLLGLNISNNVELKVLNCTGNKLQTLDVQNKTLLEILHCSINQLENLDVSENLFLEVISCSNNQLQHLDLLNNIHLKDLGVSNNQLQSLNLNNNVSLEIIYCDRNQLQSLDVSKNISLTDLSCWENQLENLDISHNPLIQVLGCSNNSIQKLTLYANPLLEQLYCQFNQLKHLDFSNNPLLNEINCTNNDIEFLNLANGSIIDCMFYCEIKNDSLKFVCIDENEYPWLDDNLGDFIDQVAVNTYCNFFLNDRVNTVIGKTQFDFSNSCSDNSIYVFKFPFLIQSNTETYKYWPSYDSINYQLYLSSGSHIIKPELDPSSFISSPGFVNLEFTGVNNNIYQDFCIGPNGEVISNISVSLIPINIAQPGFSSDYKIIIENLGNVYSSGTLDFTFPLDSVQITDSSESYSESGNMITWNYDDLPVLSRKTIYVSTINNSPMDTHPLVGGEVLKFKAEVIPNLIDTNPINNIATLCEPVVNSYDPNDKRCFQGESIYPEAIGSTLDYMIRFENTGSSEAVNITITDTLDTKVYDINTFRLTDSSHPVFVTQKEEVIEFVFNDIYLPFEDDLNDGYVVFKIKMKDDLVVGDTIANQANIYFDFNFPIITTVAMTIVESNVSNVLGLDFLPDLKVFPNPFDNLLRIEQESDRLLKTEIMDITGKRVYTSQIKNKTNQLSLSHLKIGIYFLHIYDQDHNNYYKVVKK